MGKKMRFPFFSKSSQATPSWPWPSCRNPKTLSFRCNGDVLKTINAAYIDAAQCHGPSSGYDSRISATSTKPGDTIRRNASDDIKHQGNMPEPDNIWLERTIEEVIKGLNSDSRLFFDPGETPSILEEVKNMNSPFKESVVMVMDSGDPYVDFKDSMWEMAVAHGMGDYKSLEELLNWYLRVNEEQNHGYVVGAFVDLLVELSFSSTLFEFCNDYQGESSSSNTVNDTISCPLSSSFSTISTSPCYSSLELVENDGEKEVDSGS